MFDKVHGYPFSSLLRMSALIFFIRSSVEHDSFALHTTPSFFCRLVDEVVYWNTMRLSGKT